MKLNTGTFGNKLGTNIQKINTIREIPKIFCPLFIGGKGFFSSISIVTSFNGSTSGLKTNLITNTTEIVRIRPIIKHPMK